MNPHVAVLTSGAHFTLGYAEALSKGIEANIASRKPKNPGSPDGVFDCNTPLFVYAHLGLYPARICDLLQLPAPEGIRAPASWEELFKAGAPCHHDPQGTIYPAWSAVSEHYFRSAKLAIEAMAHAKDEQLIAITADESRRGRFPTVGSMINFLLLGHTMMHLGQISTWRRCMGLPSAL